MRTAKKLIAPLLFAIIWTAAERAAAAQRGDSDGRLSQRIELRLKASRLEDAVAEMSKVSGIKMSVSKDVAELKATVFVHDLSVQVIQARLAELMNLTWEQVEGEKGHPSSYRLIRSLKDEAEEREMADRGERAFRKSIEEALRFLTLSPEEQEKMLKENPELARSLQYPGARTTLEMFAGLDKSERDKVMNGDRLDYAPDSIPEPMQQPAMSIRRAIESRDGGRRPPIPDSARTMVGRSNEGADSRLGLTFAWNNPTSSGAIGTDISGTTSMKVYPEFYRPYSADNQDPDVIKPRKLSADLEGGKKLDDQLEQLFDEWRVNIIAESYFETRQPPSANRTRWEKLTTLPKGATTLLASFEKTLPHRERYWWKNGPVYLVQKRFWWRARLSEVPDSTLAILKAMFKKGKTQTLDDWGELGRLIRAEQVGRIETERIAPLLGAIESKLPALAFYGNLQPMQRSRLFSAEGLPWRNLRKEDRARLTAAAGEAGKNADIQWEAVRVFAFKNSSGPVGDGTVIALFQESSNGEMRVITRQTVPGEAPAKYRAREFTAGH